ncbi:MAG TPA: AAC(3) family N-acetyltransferase [Gaiellaceae bacterium]|nr:AAC(3) family N-acetyltransferase [Gaiellaceae bacterium]
MTVGTDLVRLGIRPGTRVVVHSSFRAVGPVPGGPAALAQALVDAVGPDGLVVAPTFTYDTPHFDPATTPGRTGAISEALRTRPDAVRSLHPFHSVAAVGAGADRLCAGHEVVPATGLGSPLDRLAGDGHVLLLGVGHIANTTGHVGEFHADAPYLDIPFDPDWPTAAEIDRPDGGVLHVSYDRFPGCSRTFGVLEAPLRERGAVRDGRVGGAVAQLVSGAAVVEETARLVRGDSAALLCTDAACFRCSRARARL